MKRILIFLVVLFITCPLYAKEYKFNKTVNPSQLADELKTAGINLLGNDQVGYMETINGKEIRIVLKNGVTIDENKLQTVINSHIPKDYVAERKSNEDKAITKLKNLGLTSAEIGAVLKK